MTTKISSAQVSQLLKDASVSLRQVSAEKEFYKEKCAQMERRQKAEKLASTMHSKGLELDTSAETLADRLEKSAQTGDFDSIQRAVDMLGPDMSSKIASMTNDEARSAPGSDLESYIVGGVG